MNVKRSEISNKNHTWEIVIGLEAHVQLATASKLFSGSSTKFGAEPNLQANAIDLALPGVLPVLNREAVNCAIKFGLAVNGKIAPYSVFARKNYFYPDLPKGYQISQFELPVVKDGFITIAISDDNSQTLSKKVQLTRAHLEEDAGKSIHECNSDSNMSGIDFNRAGSALLEIVSEPVLSNADEAVAYAKALHALVIWIGISDGSMQEGSFRCDANISVRKLGDPNLGTRCEIKNLNSFRFLYEAINYEVGRQINLLEEGSFVIQETRLYNPEQGITRLMRSKEDSSDYRYFPDPDLLPLVIDDVWINKIKEYMPILPQVLRQQFCDKFYLSMPQAVLLTQSRQLADYFQETIKYAGAELVDLVANWITGEFLAYLKREQINIDCTQISPRQFAYLLQKISDGTISGTSAKKVFHLICQSDNISYQDKQNAHEIIIDELIAEHNFAQSSNEGEVEKQIHLVLEQNKKSVTEFLSGKEKAINSLVGKVMQAMKNQKQGQADPLEVNRLLLEILNKSKKS